MSVNNKYRYLAKNTLLFSISSFGSKVLSFLFVSVYTSVLTTEEYGTADLVWTTASLLIFIVTLNISDAVVRFALEKVDEQKGIFSYGLRVLLKGQLIFGIILFVVSCINPIQWEWYLYLLLYLTVFISAIYQITTYYLRSFDEVKSVAVAGVMNTAVTILSNVILLVVLKKGVIGYLASMIIGCAVASSYAFAVIFKRGKCEWSKVCDDKTKKMMLSYSIPLIFNGISWWINSSLDKYLITYYCGVSINGLYAVASKIPTLLTTVQGFFGEAWNLSAVKEFDKNDSDGFFSNMYSFYNGFTVVGASILILFNVLLARILFTNDFFIAWQYSSILVLSAVFSGLAGFISGIFSVVRKTGYIALSTAVGAGINIGLNTAFIPIWGAIGAAEATLISFFIVWLMRFFCVRKYIAWKISIVRDMIAYLLLCIQLYLEHLENHCYLGQIIIAVVLIFMYRNIGNKLLSLARRTIRRNRSE